MRPLSLAARTLVAALALDAVRGLWVGVAALLALAARGDAGGLASLPPEATLRGAALSLLVAAFDTTLALQLATRRRQGRWWCAAYLAVLLVAGAARMAWMDPAAWLEVGTLGRLRHLGGVALLGTGLAWLVGPGARAAFGEEGVRSRERSTA